MALEDAETGMIDPEDTGHLRADMQMHRRAIIRKWKIPDEVMDTTAEKLGQILERGKDREVIHAAKVLDSMVKTNIMIENGVGQSDQNQASVVVYIPSNHRDEPIVVNGTPDDSSQNPG
jgi:hypothetical protein